MGRKGVGIVVKVKQDFVNTSTLASISYYRCGDTIPKGKEFVVCEWDESEIGLEVVRLFRELFNGLQLRSQDIDLIINTLTTVSENYGYFIKQRICTLAYVESLLNQGLVEVEWYDWW